MPYPEKLENLLSIRQASKIWKVSPATIQTALYRGAFGDYARKIGKSWVILPEGMFHWKGNPGDNIPGYPFGIQTTQRNFEETKTAMYAYRERKISAEETLNWIESNIKSLTE